MCAFNRRFATRDLPRVDPALKCRAIFLGSLRDSFRGLRERSYRR